MTKLTEERSLQLIAECIAPDTRKATSGLDLLYLIRCVEAELQPVQSPDKGPWVAGKYDDGSVYLQSKDFTHDVRLYVDGDFAGNIYDYAEQLAAWMNSKPSQVQPVQEPDVPFPGMQEEFEAYYSQSFIDRDWRREAGVWAASWKAATRYTAPPDQTAEIKRLREELRYEKMNTEVWKRDAEGKLEDRTEAYHRIATLEAALREAKLAIENELTPCGCFQGCEFCNGKIQPEEALATINKALGEE